MDLYELRLDQPHPGTRDGDPGHGRVCQLPHPPRARAGRAPGAVAGTASRDESSMSDRARAQVTTRSEEHTSELQSRLHLVCRLLLEKKKHSFYRTYERTGGSPTSSLVHQ